MTINWELSLLKWIMALCWDIGISINMGEFAFALILMELSLAMIKAFNNERMTKSCCNWLWYCCINLAVIKYLTINQDVLFGFWLAARKLRSAGKLYWELSVAAIGCSSKGPGSWEISADSCVSAVVFNAVFGKLIYFVEVTGSNATNAKAWHETFGVENTWTFTARDWTQLVNPELRLERIVEERTQADEKLCLLAKCKCVVWGLAKRKCAFWFVMVVAETSVLVDWHNQLESKLIGVGFSHWFLELLVAAIGWLISSSIPGWSAKDSVSDLLWHSPQVWVFVESVILPGSSASCFGSLYTTQDFFRERLFGSSVSIFIHLVGLQIGSWPGSFVGSLIGCCNQITWLAQTQFPATELRLVNAFAWIAKRKSANSTKNLERVVIAVWSFSFSMLPLSFLNAVSVQFACVT
jgi:hypothetical protein